ncbi:MAG: 2-phospho-L-lactate transferase CofD family protein [Solirubrobacteraceae bacterium]
MSAPVVVLAGGTGGAKLARGMQDVVGEDLVVVANTADDVEIYGAYVSPDPDLTTFWLAGQIDERGWGLEGDTFAVMNGLRELGREVWFNLGDRDLAIGLERAERMAAGETLTETLAALGAALGITGRVLPMSDDAVRTRVRAHGRDWPFQEFMIKAGGAGPIDDVTFDGAARARPTAQGLDAVASARAIIIGPSNPVISIGPIFALPGMREALAKATAPVVAVSPLVGGKVLKGPTEPFLDWAGQPLSSDGIAALYAGVIDGLLADSPTDRVASREADVLMSDADGRRRVAEESLQFAAALAAP